MDVDGRVGDLAEAERVAEPPLARRASHKCALARSSPTDSATGYLALPPPSARLPDAAPPPSLPQPPPVLAPFFAVPFPLRNLNKPLLPEGQTWQPAWTPSE